MTSTVAPSPRVIESLQQYWGYDSLRPLQHDAIRAGIDGRDSLVVLPTGGGKSLCYQLPPVVENRTDLVISPLIALMKDQVDSLRANGVPAAAVYGGIPIPEMRKIAADLQAGKLRLLFTAPERVLSTRFVNTVREANIRAIAIDEAHCISHWGHDFRPEYRRLSELKHFFPNASRHAFTATATEQVRSDIVRQLDLTDPVTLVGSFDRPNLTYRVIPRRNRTDQIVEILRRHETGAVIIYCLSRKDTEELTATLKVHGFTAAHYHAGLDPAKRQRTQEDFSRERVNIICATVAFGMGIDRSDVRAVIHATMPKSVEHYQQEAGRAGRDGLPAECVLLYSAADVMKWEGLIQKSADEADFNVDPVITKAMFAMLRQMQAYATSMDCRHAALVRHFGQELGKDNCEACDTCLGEVADVEDCTVQAQKILSCVARLEERFGVGHIVDVLQGANTERIRSFGHDQLSTYSLLADMSKDDIRKRVHDLLDQGMLVRKDIASGTKTWSAIGLNDASWEVMRGNRKVHLAKLEKRAVRSKPGEGDPWAGVDRECAEALRQLRTELAEEENTAAFIIMHDATLRDLAKHKPINRQQLLGIQGIGKAKAKRFGDRIITVIQRFRDPNETAVDDTPPRPSRARFQSSKTVTAAKAKAFEMFAEGTSLEEVATSINRAPSTTSGYLAEYIALKQPESISAWVDDETYERVATAFDEHGSRRLKIVHEALNGEVSYEVLKIVAAYWEELEEGDDAS